MSFLLQGPMRQKNNQSGKRKQLPVNDRIATGRMVGDDSRIFPGLGSTSFNRGNRNLSQQQLSGNQIMLQRRQESKNIVSKLRKQQFQKSEQLQKQKQEEIAKQKQENLGDYTMDRSKYSQHDGSDDETEAH